MKSQTTEKNEFAEYNDMIGKLRKSLRHEVLAEIKSNGIRESMIGEYRSLANSAGRLIDLLKKNDFPTCLGNEDAGEYEEIMRTLSTSGIRCHILVEESRSVDREAILAMATPPCERIN